MSTVSTELASQTDDRVWVIQPRREGLVARMRDVWRYRQLMRFFAVKAIQKQYRRTVLGMSWLFIRPLFPLAVNTLVFGRMLGVGSAGLPYFLFLVGGTTIWEFFAASLTWGTRSLELNRGFMSRIYVPRLIMLVSATAPAFVNLAISLAVLTGGVIYYWITTDVMHVAWAKLGWAVLAVGLTAFFTIGISLWTSVPALQARDVRFTLGYVLGFWVFLTPVLYPIRLAPGYEWVLTLNPMAAFVNTFKYGMFGVDVFDTRGLVVAVLVSLVTFTSGLWFFSRAESDAADKV
jgi:lipopolysaccharide transport system permease protein